jgi:hypothetical protein
MVPITNVRRHGEVPGSEEEQELSGWDIIELGKQPILSRGESNIKDAAYPSSGAIKDQDQIRTYSWKRKSQVARTSIRKAVMAKSRTRPTKVISRIDDVEQEPQHRTLRRSGSSKQDRQPPEKGGKEHEAPTPGTSTNWSKVPTGGWRRRTR